VYALHSSSKGSLFVKARLTSDAMLHHMMSLIGGFFGGYAILLRSTVFGSAQTSNLMNLVIDLLGCDFWSVLIRIGAMLLYGLAAGLTVVLTQKTKCDLKRCSLAISAVATLALGFFPAEMNNVLALYPVFFAMSFQWNAFPGANGWVSSTIFSTNNVRQTALALANYCCTKEASSLRKARFFAGSLLFFHLGVALSYGTIQLWQIHAIWFVLPLIGLATAQLCLQIPVSVPKKKAAHAGVAG
jgi:uncharacterized membrane protein YoaK (UPF0700 family)